MDSPNPYNPESNCIWTITKTQQIFNNADFLRYLVTIKLILLSHYGDIQQNYVLIVNI